MQKSPSFSPSSHHAPSSIGHMRTLLAPSATPPASGRRAPSAPPPASGWRSPLLPTSGERLVRTPPPSPARSPARNGSRASLLPPPLSHDGGGGRNRLCSAARCHPPAPHAATLHRIRAGGGSTRWPARAAYEGAAGGQAWLWLPVRRGTAFPPSRASPAASEAHDRAGRSRQQSGARGCGWAEPAGGRSQRRAGRSRQQSGARGCGWAEPAA